MDAPILLGTLAAVSGLNLLTLVVIAWKGGHLVGSLVERVTHLEKQVDRLLNGG